MGLRDRARGFFRRDNSRPGKKGFMRPNSRLEVQSVPTSIVHTPAPQELAPRLSSISPRTVPTDRKRRSHSGRPTSKRRRSGHGKNHPAHRARQKAKTGRKDNVRRQIAAKK